MIYGDITNCTVIGKGIRSEYQCRFGYEILSENVATNTRKLKLQLEVRTIDEDYTTYGYSQTSTVNGKVLEPAIFSVRNVNEWQVFGILEIEIKGAYKGTKTGSFTTNADSTWSLKSGSASVYIELENLHTPPEINSIDIQEVNSLLNAFDEIVQSLSLKNFTFDTTTYDDATILSYQIYHNGVLIGSSTQNGMAIDFDKVGTLATFLMNDKTYCTLKFTIIDSFEVSSSIEKQYQVIQYVKPNLVKTSSNIKRNGQLTGKVKLNLIGSFFNQLVNDIQNTISLQFAYWKKNEKESTTYYEIPFDSTNTGNNINIFNWNIAIKNDENVYVEIEDVNKDYAYYFKIIAVDYFGKKSEIILLCARGEWVWAEFMDRVDFKAITIGGESFQGDIVADCDPIWTGRIVNGKKEYIKRIVTNIEANATTDVSTGLNASDYEIHNYFAYISDGLGTGLKVRDGFYMGTENYFSAHIVNGTDIRIITGSGTTWITNDLKCYIDVYFTKLKGDE